MEELFLVVVDDFLGLEFSEALLLFLHGVNPQGDLDALTLGGSTEDAANGTGGEAPPTDQHGHITMIEDETEGEMIGVDLSNPELGLFRVVDELEGNILEKTPDLIGCLVHDSCWEHP